MTKEEIEKILKTSDFIHSAFCIDGETKFVKITEPTAGFNCTGMLFQCEDSKRGLFFVGIYKEI